MVKGIVKKTDESLKGKKEFLKPLFRSLGMMYNGKRLVEKRRVKEMEKTCKKPWEYGPLAAAKGKPYLVTGDKPFFWLGDTAWLLFHNLKKEEVEVYLRNRAEKGYNVIQATLFHFAPCENAYGARGFLEEDVTKPNLEGEFTYWDMVDYVVKTAEKYGLYMAMLPHWGGIVKSGWTDPEKVKVYAAFLAERYKDAPNVIWITGGDTRGNEAFEYWNNMGSTLKKLNPDKLVCFHPFGRTTSIDYFPNADWLDMHMFQSGHRRYDQIKLKAWDDNDQDDYSFGEDNWKYVERVHRMTAQRPEGPMPVLDAEPSYENIPQGLHGGAEPMWRDRDVRRYAYWSVLAGACGFTYGHNAIMQMWHTRDKAGNYDCWEKWSEAIHHPGSDSMKHLTELMNSVDFINGHPAQELLADEPGEKYERISVFAGPDYLLAYSYTGRKIQLKENALDGEAEVYWMNPLTGVMSYAGVTDFTEARVFVTPSKEYMPNRDWVLVLRRK